MDYLPPILIIEKITDGDLLPKGTMFHFCGSPESIPEGWVLVDREELMTRLLKLNDE